MVVLSQFDVAAGIMGRDQAHQLLLDTLEDVDVILADLARKMPVEVLVADRLHTHLNSLTALGACEVARLLGDVETDLREQRVISASVYQSVSSFIQETRTFFVSYSDTDRVA